MDTTETEPVIVVVGTRPEVIKLAPVVRALKDSRVLEPVVIAVRQHTDLLTQAMSDLNVCSNFEIVCDPGQFGLTKQVTEISRKFESALSANRSTHVIVQGDTASAFGCALAAKLSGRQVCHVEAGLRSHVPYEPHPEELYRTMLADLADIHYCPSAQAKKNLLAEGISETSILVTGNTIVDTILQQKGNPNLSADGDKTILLTVHRRVSVTHCLPQIFEGVARLIDAFPDYKCLFPMHPNPKIKEGMPKKLLDEPRFIVMAPQPYTKFLAQIETADLIITDSGGIQEEAMVLATPTLVIRDETERFEALTYPHIKLVGTTSTAIFQNAQEILLQSSAKNTLRRYNNEYGNGTAAKQICNDLQKRLVSRRLSLRKAQA